jgi:hypothetical protein
LTILDKSFIDIRYTGGADNHVSINLVISGVADCVRRTADPRRRELAGWRSDPRSARGNA